MLNKDCVRKCIGKYIKNTRNTKQYIINDITYFCSGKELFKRGADSNTGVTGWNFIL